jgi:hypothetical protein
MDGWMDERPIPPPTGRTVTLFPFRSIDAWCHVVSSHSKTSAQPVPPPMLSDPDHLQVFHPSAHPPIHPLLSISYVPKIREKNKIEENRAEQEERVAIMIIDLIIHPSIHP